MRYLILIAFALTQMAGSVSAEEPASAESQFRIDAIVIEGLFLTKPNVVTRELTFGEGELVSRKQIDLSIQRLRNLGIFRIADYQLLDRRIPLPSGEFPEGTDDHRILLITVDERWTLIPFGTFAAGGGTFSLTTGLYDVNLLGRYIQLGGQYQHFAGTNSFAVWAEDPRFLGRRMSLGGTIAQTNRIQFFYDDAGDVEGGHLRLRKSARVSFGIQWLEWLRSGIALGFSDDQYSTDLLSEELIELELQRGLPAPTHYTTLSVSTSVGRIDADSYLRRGLALSWGASAAKDGLGSNLSYVDNAVQVTGFAILPLRANIGVRLGIAHTTLDRPEYHYFIGGFNVLRGFLHRRYHGTHYWYGNAELRVPSIDTRWLVLQHIGFLDASGIGQDFDVVRELDGMSTGVGLRILSPKIFSLIARVDYAWSLVGDGRSAISFGAGQFF